MKGHRLSAQEGWAYRQTGGHSSRMQDCWMPLGEKGRVRDNVSSRTLAGSRLSWVKSHQVYANS